MGKLVVVNHISLDGVMQAPARTDEDRRGGFQHGGWAVPNNDPVMGQKMAQKIHEGKARGSSLLLGRRTYQDFADIWPAQPDNPFTAVLDNARKYVASNTLQEPLPWRNSKLLAGDAADAVAELKCGEDLTLLGSGELLWSLTARDLIDQYLLMIHPLILGCGRRLFADDTPFAKLRLADSVTTTTGVVIANYEAC